SNWNFAWNVGGGVGWYLNENLSLDLGYRYVDLGTAAPGHIKVENYVTDANLDYTAHELSVGLRFNLN
ncbi:MAG: outer membrane protein, partial [Candidatus Adiutrix sp.]